MSVFKFLLLNRIKEQNTLLNRTNSKSFGNLNKNKQLETAGN